MKKTIIWIVVIIALILCIFLGLKNKDDGSLKIGAVLPMTGPSAIYGEFISKGMKLALSEIKDNKIKLIIEDTQANPSFGVSAYQKVVNENSKVVVSAFSGVSVPLTKIALQNKIPLIMTIVAGAGVTDDYSYRYYAKPEEYANPAFFDAISPIKNSGDIAVLYRNDEYGNSVKKVIEDLSKQTGHNILAEENYLPDTKDFKTQLTKIKASHPKALVFLAANQGEATTIIKDANELGLDTDIIEASANLANLNSLADLPAGKVYYSTNFSYLQDGGYVKFKDKYKAMYNQEPYFAASLGYDIVKLIVGCAYNTNGMSINACLDGTKSVDGVTGKIDNITNHEINPPMQLVKITR
ncbi:MAG: ABC transporter substrate-binding protein [bacterium]